jgi:glycosyltransferase involved in cell wall biosynthesis
MPYPFSYDGGAERSTAWLARALVNLGHDVRTVGGYRDADLPAALDAGMTLGCISTRATDGSIHAEHDGVNLRMIRRVAFQSACHEELEERPPDLVLTHLEGSGIVISLTALRGVPTILRLVGPCTVDTYPVIGRNVLLVANSPLIAKMGAAHYRRPVGFIITPVEKNVPQALSTQAHYVTFVNPRRDKGLHLFARVAALRPRLPFLIIMGWQSHEHQADERQALSFLQQLSNVTVRKSTVRMSEVYSRTRVLLVPSRWPESWPRVVGEAQAYGIPVIGSSIGCVPHAVGSGGVVLPYADPDLWCRVLDHVYEDQSLRERLSRGAIESVMRFHDDIAAHQWIDAIDALRHGEPWSRSGEIDSIPLLRAMRNQKGHLQLCDDWINWGDNIIYEEPAYP